MLVYGCFSDDLEGGSIIEGNAAYLEECRLIVRDESDYWERY